MIENKLFMKRQRQFGVSVHLQYALAAKELNFKFSRASHAFAILFCNAAGRLMTIGRPGNLFQFKTNLHIQSRNITNL
jgi:hypothetical protein